MDLSCSFLISLAKLWEKYGYLLLCLHMINWLLDQTCYHLAQWTGTVAGTVKEKFCHQTISEQACMFRRMWWWSFLATYDKSISLCKKALPGFTMDEAWWSKLISDNSSLLWPVSFSSTAESQMTGWITCQQEGTNNNYYLKWYIE